MEVSEAKRLKMLEDESTRLKRLLADAVLDNGRTQDWIPGNVCSGMGVDRPLCAPATASRESALGLRAAPSGIGRSRAPPAIRRDMLSLTFAT